MIAPLLLNLAASLGGAIVGRMDSKSANIVELKKIDAERERDMMLGQQGQIKDYYDSLDRHDDPKKFTKKGKTIFGRDYEKTTYRYVPIPARQQQYNVVLLLSFAYALIAAYCAIDADRIIWSFAAAPENYKFLSLFGFSLLEGTKNNVYQLTLGGLILPLLSPISFAISKYIAGPSALK